ncbi:MAG: 2-hydroxyacid dehydrogenase [Blastocatellia bacterium]
MRPRVFVTHQLPAPALERLAAVCDYDTGTDNTNLPRDVFLRGVRDASGLICMLTDRIDHEIITASPHLKIIANVAAGYNNIDVALAQTLGIYVTNTPDVLTDATADLTWALILAATRRIVEADAFVRAGKFRAWDINLFTGMGLAGKTLGIAGYGRIGRAVARRATGFGMSVLYCGRNEIAFRDDPARCAENPPGLSGGDPGLLALRERSRHATLQDGLNARRAEFYQLLARSDIVSLHVPLTAATRHLIDSAALTRMKPGAYLINTSRGEVVEENALIAALRQQRIAGAALDVYENEPAIVPALPELPNITLTPHIGSATREARTAMAMLAVENTIDALSGREPRNLIT